MTRGIIIFIDHEGYYYISIEFYGDMHPYNRGSIIIDRYKNGKIKTKLDFTNFVYEFDENHYYYGMGKEELINFGKISDNKISLLDYFPDHFYIINHSGSKVEFTSKYGCFDIENDAMTIIHYENIEQIVKVNDSSNGFLSKKRFVDILKRLEMADDLSKKVKDLVSVYGKMTDHLFTEAEYVDLSCAEIVIELLDIILHDKTGKIDYFIHEMDYGRKKLSESNTDEYKSKTSVSDVEELYNQLVEDNHKGIILGEFLNMTSADDYYWINVRGENQQIYYGYVHEIPDEYKSYVIQGIYVDWASECLGITVLT